MGDNVAGRSVGWRPSPCLFNRGKDIRLILNFPREKYFTMQAAEQNVCQARLASEGRKDEKGRK